MVTFSILFAAFVTMAFLFGVLDFELPEYVVYVVFSFSCILLGIFFFHKALFCGGEERSFDSFLLFD